LIVEIRVPDIGIYAAITAEWFVIYAMGDGHDKASRDTSSYFGLSL